MEAESSQAVGRRIKRPSCIAALGDESEEATPPSNSRVKRQRSSPILEDSNLDILNDEEDLLGEDDDRSLTDDDRSLTETNGHGGRHTSGVDDMEEDGRVGPKGFRPEYERDKDGFVAGSITHIRMKNFMTYDIAEFRPGPHLNMVLGPNGTGKSSIAAAIAIGLGFHPKTMARAPDLKSYVKQGAEIAETEIELKGKPGKENVVIWRRFTREDDKSEWRVDGKVSTKTAATDIVEKMGIQANNLCSFLPQDKVSSFAKMAPDTVLKETIRTAGDPRLTRWHETLVEKGAKAKELEASLEKDVERRDLLRSQVDRLEPQVRNFRARQDQEIEREVLECLIPVRQNKDIREKHIQLMEERKDLRRKQKESEQKRKPLLDLAGSMTDKLHKAEAHVKISDDQYMDFHKNLRNCGKQLDKAAEDGEGVDAQLDLLNKKMRRQEEEKDKYRGRIRAAQRILDSGQADVGDQIQLKAQEKRECFAKARHLFNDLAVLRKEAEDSQDVLAKLSSDIDDRLRRQQQLSSVEIQRENKATDFDPSIGFALDWIAKNAHELESTVHKPPMISVNVSNRDYAWQVEACTNVSQRKTFICQSPKDYENLLKLNGTPYEARRQMNGRMSPAGKVALNLAVIAYTDETANPPRPCTPEQLAELGFDGFAVDFVDAEGPVIAYLNQYAGMHRAALTQRPGSSVNTDKLTGFGITTWITKTDNNRAIRSSYGRRDFQIRSEAPRPAVAFNLAVDVEAVKRIVDEIAEMKKAKRDREAPHCALLERVGTAKKKAETVKEQNLALENELGELKKLMSGYSKAKTDKTLAEGRLADLEAEPSVEAQRAELRKKKMRFAQKQAEPLKAYQTWCEDTVTILCDASVKDAFHLLSCQLNSAVIQQKLLSGDADEENMTKQIHIMTEEINELKAASLRLGEEIRATLPDRHSSVISEVKKRSNEPDFPTEQSLRSELAAVNADLEASVGVDPMVIERFDKLSRELEALQSSVKHRERDVGKAKHSINQILSEFDPALDTLVDVVSKKFAEAFERVGCTGEVKINRVEGDFAAWGIQILVSYRDGDNLQLLTGSLQSGGERSLATVTYLMSLSEMARTPFSLVDEINQGMDQKAERNVHNQLVEVTCGTDAGQYFLITPKLLTDLKYHPKMKVLFINNGSWLPDSSDKAMRYGDLRSCLTRYSQNHVMAH